jgi:hypothetical protein
VATTANITLAGFQTIDGVTPVEADTNLRVLVKNQTDTTQNGIYNMASGTWLRSTDFNGAYDVVKGTEVTVQEGTVNGGFFFVVATSDPIVIGTSALAFTSSTSAANSAVSAAASAVAAQTAETNAAASAVAAQTAETNAAASAVAAQTAETNAEIAEVNAAASAVLAAASSVFVQPDAGAISRTTQDKLRESVSVKDFGAVGDGSTDDTTEIQAAITAAIARNAPTAIYFPAGVYVISSTLTCDPTTQANSKVVLCGDGPSASVIKAKAGFTASKLLHMGASGTTTRMQGSGMVGLGFDGNSLPASGGVAGVYIYNAYRCMFKDIAVDSFGGSGVGDGLASYGNVAGVSGDPCNQGNTFHNIYTRNNGGAGQYYRGEKSSVFDMLQSDSNAVQGFFWDSESITAGSTETTECVIGAALAKNNTGVGFAFSGIAKFSIGNLEAYINGSVGVLFSDTRSGTTVPSVYSSIGSIVSRNNAGALANATGTNANYCQGVDIGSIVHVGGKGLGVSETEAAAVVIAGWYGCTIGRINSELNIGTCLRVLDQTGARYSTGITFGEVVLLSNGSANAASNHGVSIEGNSSLITINKLHSANSYTTAAKSSYEVVTAAAASASINNAYVYAAEAARELSIGNQSIVSFGGTSNVRGVQAERKITGLAAASAVTAYGTYASEFWDNSVAIRKYARMSDGSLRILSGEKGTFTPAFTFVTPGNQTIAYSTQVGRYEVRGSKCFVEILLSMSTFTHSTAAGNARITGLPFAASASSNDGAPLTLFSGITKANYTQFAVLTQNGQTYLLLGGSGSGQAFGTLTTADLPTGGTKAIKVAFDYEVDLPLA